jgi:hypothetical protein
MADNSGKDSAFGNPAVSKAQVWLEEEVGVSFEQAVWMKWAAALKFSISISPAILGRTIEWKLGPANFLLCPSNPK